MEKDTIELDHDTAAILIKADGSMELYIPRVSDDLDREMPNHSMAAALASYWAEYSEEIMQWFSEQARH